MVTPEIVIKIEIGAAHRHAGRKMKPIEEEKDRAVLLGKRKKLRGR